MDCCKDLKELKPFEEHWINGKNYNFPTSINLRSIADYVQLMYIENSLNES